MDLNSSFIHEIKNLTNSLYCGSQVLLEKTSIFENSAVLDTLPGQVQNMYWEFYKQIHESQMSCIQMLRCLTQKITLLLK